MLGYYGVKLGRHWNGLKIEIWDLQDLHKNAVYLVLKGEIIFIPKIIKTYRGAGRGHMDEKMGISSHYGDSPSLPSSSASSSSSFHLAVSLPLSKSHQVLCQPEDGGDVPKVSFRFLFLHRRTKDRTGGRKAGQSKLVEWRGAKHSPSS